MPVIREHIHNTLAAMTCQDAVFESDAAYSSLRASYNKSRPDVQSKRVCI